MGLDCASAGVVDECSGQKERQSTQTVERASPFSLPYWLRLTSAYQWPNTPTRAPTCARAISPSSPGAAPGACEDRGAATAT